MSLVESFLPVVPSAIFAGAGWWVQLHPEKIFGEGHFITEKSWRRFLELVAFLGTFMVFAGTMGTVSSLLALLTFHVAWLEWVARLLALVAGVAAAVYVRREVKAKPPHVSKNPYGWWP
jgi:hypothetical protein